MSVEQTSQLIQLILNSVLMTFICMMAMGRLGVRHTAVEERLKQASYQYADLRQKGQRIASEPRPTQAKKALLHLKRRHQVTRYSLLLAHYALLFAISSTLAMVLRALIYADWLIIFSLCVFVVSVLLLLVSIGLTLLDLQTSRLPLWEEMKLMFQLGQRKKTPKTATKPVRPARRSLKQRPSPIRLPAKARVV
jgi:hypothetical protein